MNSLAIRGLMACVVFAAALAMPTAGRAQVVVVVNGTPITELDIQQRTKLLATSGGQRASRKEIIQQLIDDRLKIAKAKVYGLVISESQIDQAFGNMAQRQGVSPEQFTEFLNRSGVTPYAVKQRIRAELTWGQLIRGKYSSSLNVTDADVDRAVRARNQGTTEAGSIYTLYPVTVVVAPDSSQAVVAQKRRAADDLRSRFTSCAQGLPLARAIRDVAVREPITRSSADLPAPLRELLDKMPLGHLTAPDVTSQGLQMFALCDRKQTTHESPLKAQLRKELFDKRYAAVSRSFLEELRRSAWIEYKQ